MAGSNPSHAALQPSVGGTMDAAHRQGSQSVLPPRSSVEGEGKTTSKSHVSVPTVEGYQIIDRIGEGGMGTVWRAWQMSAKREVALKLLEFTAGASEKAKRRFDREVEVTSRLQHPNITRLYDSGIHHGVYFYAMELIDGEPLDTYARKQKISRKQSLALMQTICLAVHYAHQRGVIHRDLKPSNILIDKFGQPHVVDFGLGKLFDQPQATHAVDAPITIEGEWAGTPAYMSPEQAAGRADDLDTRSDIYTLGVVLYQLLIGKTPHDSTGGHVKVLQRVMDEEIVRPRKAAPDLDPDLEALLLRALAKRADDRYTSAAAMAEDIANFLKGEPITARQPTALYFMKKKLRKHRLPVTAVAAGLMAIISLSVYGSIQVAHERDAAAASARDEHSLRILAESRYAEGLISWADALSAAGNWADARPHYWDAYDIQHDQNILPAAAGLGLLETYQHSPLPLTEFDISKGVTGDRLSKLPVTFSTDGGSVVWMSRHGVIHSTQLPGGKAISAVGEPNDMVYAAAFSGDGKSLVRVVVGRTGKAGDAGASTGPAIEVVDVTTGSVKKTINLVGGLGFRPSISPDGRFVAYVRTDEQGNDLPRELVLYDLAGPNQDPKILDSKAAPLLTLAFSSDSSTLFAGSNTGGIARWHVSGVPGREYSDTGCENIVRIAASPDGEELLLGTRSGQVMLFDLKAGKTIRTLADTNQVAINDLAFSPDDSSALACDDSGMVRQFDISTGRLARSIKAHSSRVETVNFSPDGKLAASTGIDGRARIWSLADEPPLTAHPKPITCVALSRDGRLAAVGHGDHILLLVDTTTGKTLRSFDLQWPLGAVRFSPDSLMLYAADDQGGIRTLNTLTGAIVSSFVEEDPVRPGEVPHAGALRSGRTYFSPDGRRSVRLNIRGAVLWDVLKGTQIRILDTRPSDVACFSADGKSVMVATTDHTHQLKLYETTAGAEQPFPVEDSTIITALAISPDRRTALIGHINGEIRALDLATRQWTWTESAHVDRVRCLFFAPDGRTALSGGQDGTLQLRDAISGRLLRTVATGPSPVAAVAFSEQGEKILATTGDGTTSRVWDLRAPLRFRTP